MTNSRRNFCRNSVYAGLGLGICSWPTLANAKQTSRPSVLNLSRSSANVIQVSGKICYADLSVVKNAQIEIWHNNTAQDAESFAYQGQLQTDAEGNYSFETDMPDRHFEDGYKKMRRIFIKIKTQSGQTLATKLYLGFDGHAYIDGNHVAIAPTQFKTELPKTNFDGNNLASIQFNVYLNH
jgi:protocatechuate 3,4-dioxygenase beta subunit